MHLIRLAPAPHPGARVAAVKLARLFAFDSGFRRIFSVSRRRTPRSAQQILAGAAAWSGAKQREFFAVEQNKSIIGTAWIGADGQGRADLRLGRVATTRFFVAARALRLKSCFASAKIKLTLP